MDTLPIEIHAYICAFLPPVTRTIAAMAWRGFGRPSPMTFNEAVFAAVISDDVPVLNLLARTGRLIPSHSCHSAVLGGAINALRWANARGHGDISLAAEAAAARGQLECLKYIAEKRPSINCEYLFRIAVARGHIECAEYLYCRIKYDPLEKSMIHIDAFNGGLDAVKYLCRTGLINVRGQILNVLQQCSAECIEYMISYGIELPDNNLLYFDHCTSCVLPKLKVFTAAGCMIGRKIVEQILIADCVRCFDWVQSHRCAPKITERIMYESGAIKCLARYHENNPSQLGPDDLLYVISMGRIEMVKYMHRAGVRSPSACERAARILKSTILCWLIRKGGYIIGDELRLVYSKREYIKVLRAMRWAGQEWSRDAMLYAAQRTNIKGLKYMHKHGADIDFGACAAAIIEAHDACIRTSQYIRNSCTASFCHKAAINWVNEMSGLNVRLHYNNEVI